MVANDIILYFSIFVTVCVTIWAIVLIRTYDSIDKKK